VEVPNQVFDQGRRDRRPDNMEIPMGSLGRSEIMSLAALAGVVVLAAVGSIGGEAAVTFIGGLMLKNPAGALKR